MGVYMRYFKDSNDIVRAYDESIVSSPWIKLRIKNANMIEIDEDVALQLVQRRNNVVEAQTWAKSELAWCDAQRAYHETGDSQRALSTIENINAYTIACRDYVTKNERDEYIIAPERPQRPS
ncbi:hypothetical protein CGK40_23225 [Vibrio parahaemolyticus]|nr:hypothetical protein CGK40_23225 [Vibrio parahaemolyticus]